MKGWDDDAECAHWIGLTESRASQLHTIMRLKAHLSAATREPAEI